jgi:serine/threonine protein kinase/Leucine-rich repeat (LRR) protein
MPGLREPEPATTNEATKLVGDGENGETLARPVAIGNLDSPRFAAPSHDGDIGRLGKYRIQKELGRGGMGAVYLAFDERLQRKVALKVMLPRAAADATARERFLREARAAAQISSDHVVNIFEADEIDGTPYIALQFLQGYPLDEYLRKKGDLTIPQVVRIAADTALGLSKAHKLGIVHRDIKPGNLWLEAPAGRVKILDFGLAKPVVGSEAAELTGSGAVMGTPAYMAPEQGMGQPVDVRADLFSLGCVLYRLCTGKLPFDRPTIMAILKAIATEEPPPVRKVNPAVPEPLADLIRRLMAKKPDQRPASAEAVVKELDRISALLKAGDKAEASTSQPHVVYVPVAVSIVQPNPFEDIGEASTNFDSLQPKAELPPKPPNKFPAKLVGGLALGLVAIVAAGIIIKITNKDGTTTTIEVPDGSKIEVNGKTVQVTPPKTEPPKKETPVPPANAGTEREIAKWVLSMGGVVTANWQEPGGKHTSARFVNPADLPKADLRLVYVEFVNTPKLTDEGLAKLQGCLSLETFWCGSNPQISDKGFLFLREMKHLTNLSITYTNITDDALDSFAKCRNLTYLNLEATKVTEKGLTNLKRLDRLMVLSLSGIPVGDAYVAGLKDYPALQHLDLRGAKYTGAGIDSLKECKRLISLDLRNAKPAPEKIADLKKALPRCKILLDESTIEPDLATDRKAAEWVLAQSGEVLASSTDHQIPRGDVAGVHYKAGMPLPKEPFRLTGVMFAGVKTLTNDGLANLKGCTDIRTVGLGGTAVTDKGLVHLKDTPYLAYLSLAYLKDMTDEGLSAFKNHREIAQLELDGTSVGNAGLAVFKDCKLLTYLHLGSTQIDDAALTQFAGYPQLSNLRLEFTKITDAGLDQLKAVKSLTTLSLKGTKVTAAKIEELRKALPKCRIESDHGTFEPK